MDHDRWTTILYSLEQSTDTACSTWKDAHSLRPYDLTDVTDYHEDRVEKKYENRRFFLCRFYNVPRLLFSAGVPRRIHNAEHNERRQYHTIQYDKYHIEFDTNLGYVPQEDRQQFHFNDKVNRLITKTNNYYKAFWLQLWREQLYAMPSFKT